MALGLSGCAYKVHVIAIPEGASIRLPNGRNVLLPSDVKLKWAPFMAQRVVISAPGFRPLEINMQRRVIRGTDLLFDPVFRPRVVFGKAARREVQYILVPEHDESGTWSAEDVPR